ncbi:prohibitin family protein [Entomomonas moraniae]|uniref:Prohibitin family protein n=1 Tax=Entomomonas moraniae TaxID=2213226 RepID=A0A3Q9JLJ9_9GAMM|nr:SPFH domain-containing protein [Entomomonas moraniae]AZS50931.1 prohibitin family protein [Entomomonas moraniae]
MKPLLSKCTKLKWPLITIAVLGAIGYGVYKKPPFTTVHSNELGIRTNLLTGNTTQFKQGSAIVIPGINSFKRISLKDRVLQPKAIASSASKEALQSLEGLSIGANVIIRYNVNETNLLNTYASIPDNDKQVVESAFYGIAYKIFSKYTVREIFSSKRDEITETLENSLKPLLAHDGLALKSIQLGSIDLPSDYRKGMDSLLAEELASEKMRYTIELQKKKLQAKELEAESEKQRREIAAQAEAKTQIIAAQAQEEAMKHIIPFKQRQIEQRKLEAEADTAARIQEAQGNAKARIIEADGEASARKKLAESDAYRIEQIGKANANQMAKEGELISKHPGLIQKAMVDKLSDKIQVIIAPPSTSGFVGDNLLGNGSRD